MVGASTTDWLWIPTFDRGRALHRTARISNQAIAGGDYMVLGACQKNRLMDGDDHQAQSGAAERGCHQFEPFLPMGIGHWALGIGVGHRDCQVLRDDERPSLNWRATTLRMALRRQLCWGHFLAQGPCPPRHLSSLGQLPHMGLKPKMRPAAGSRDGQGWTGV